MPSVPFAREVVRMNRGLGLLRKHGPQGRVSEFNSTIYIIYMTTTLVIDVYNKCVNKCVNIIKYI